MRRRVVTRINFREPGQLKAGIDKCNEDELQKKYLVKAEYSVGTDNFPSNNYC